MPRSAAEIAAGIRRLGFRRWYERQLLESHFWLISCILAMLLVAVCLEDLSFKEGAMQALLLMTVSFASSLLALSAWRRYLGTMARAERLGSRSCCARCDTYGRFEVLASGASHADAAVAGGFGWLRVRCKQCGHEWTLE
jgi:hypothetical protein